MHVIALRWGAICHREQGASRPTPRTPSPSQALSPRRGELDLLSLLPDFSDSLMTFIPKGTEPNDAAIVIRGSDATRPLSLSNSDAKAIAATVVGPLNKKSDLCVDSYQGGFVLVRAITENLLEEEGRNLVNAMVGERAANPLLDFETAFSSIEHIAMDPIIRWFRESALSRFSYFNACADDLSVSMRNYRIALGRVMELWRQGPDAAPHSLRPFRIYRVCSSPASSQFGCFCLPTCPDRAVLP